jgi:uncharacterized protein
MAIPMTTHLLLLALCVGLIGGLTSGLCGFSPGGALVVFSNILLGVDQHLAQGISLAAQIPPTSVSAIRRYRSEGHTFPLRWLLWLVAGFPVGTFLGALLASRVSSAVLQWSYVGYLAVLGALLIGRDSPQQPAASGGEPPRVFRSHLLTIGLLAGVFSGYLGIGGGLAIIAGLSGVLKMTQHQAQMASLLVSLIPATIPAAYVYWRANMLAPWPILIAVMVGLWAGTLVGALGANRMSSRALRATLLVMITAMATYMAFRALHRQPR